MSKNKPIFAPASLKQKLMLQRVSDTQIVLIGGAAGSGKSHILNHLPLMLVDDPDTNCIMYRRTNPQLDGGLWPNGRKIWANLPDWVPDQLKPKSIREQAKEIVLNNGAKIKYQQAENTARACDDAQGQEYTLIAVDEATQHDWVFLEYLMSRLRSRSSHFSRMVMSCNPDPDHELRKVIDWYIGEDGFVIPERDGVTRYFITENGEWLWGNTKQELADRYDIPEDKWEGKILSFAFVAGTIYDNPIMIELNPSYLAFLEGLNEVDKAKLLHGNWDARAKGANYFERSWLKETTKIPQGTVFGRGYDLAATERSQVNKNPDATTGVKMHKCKDGYFYLVGDFHPDFIDEETLVSGRVCARVGSRDKIMLKQAQQDGSDCLIVLPVDPAAAGKQVYQEMAKKFANKGYRVKKDPVAGNKAKLTRFLPFADAAENGLIYIVRSSFDKVTYEWVMKEMESFDGERSTATRKDDFPDCIASIYNYLCQAKVRRPYGIPSATGSGTPTTLYHKHKDRVK